MNLQLISKDSPFLAALRDGTEFRRMLLADGQRKRNAADDLCENDELMAELVNHCFWSSIAVEEGRSVKGSLCICSPDEAPLARVLRDPVPVSVKVLVTLLTASPQSPLAVQADSNGLEIWGFLDAKPMFRPALRIAGTGTVVASTDRRILAVLQGGKVLLPKHKGADHTNLILLVADVLDKTKSFEDRLQLAHRFLRIVLAIHQQGHGGALVVVPTSTTTWESHVELPYSLDDSSSLVLQQRVNDWEMAAKRSKELESETSSGGYPSLCEMHKGAAATQLALLDATLRSIGDFSAIDGAVVVDEKLKFFGFGAKLESESSEFQVTEIDAFCGEIKEVACSRLGGTRHQSAARFVKENGEALVFVASQDGRLSLLGCVSGTNQVLVMRGLEHFVWEHSH